MKRSWLLGVVAFFCVSGGLRGVAWSEPERLVPHNTYYVMPSLVIDNSGIAWVVLWDWILNYPDEQTGWQKVTEYTLGTYSFSGNACFDKDNRLWVLMTDDMMNALYTCYHAGIWSGVDTVATNSGVHFADITADSGGGVWVGWSPTMWGSIWWDVGYNRYKDGSWDAPNVLTDTLENTDHVIQAMTTDAYGRVWIVWLNYGDVDKEPYESLESAYHDGDDWSEAILVCVLKEKFGDKGAHGALALAPDSEGGVWVLRVWSYEVSSILVSYWNGEYWSSVDTIAEAGNLFEATPRCKLAVDSYGNAWAVWRQALEYNDKYGDIYYSVNSGSGWSEPAPVDTHPAVDRYPDIAVDGAGRVWCVWSSTRDDSAGVWASYTTSAGVEEEGFIQPPKSTIESILPNPFKSSTTISYSVAGRLGSKASQFVELKVFDVTGREIKVLESGVKRPGYYELVWNGKDDKGLRCAAGVYFVRMHGNDFNANARLVLLR